MPRSTTPLRRYGSRCYVGVSNGSPTGPEYLLLCVYFFSHVGFRTEEDPSSGKRARNAHKSCAAPVVQCFNVPDDGSRSKINAQGVLAYICHGLTACLRCRPDQSSWHTGCYQNAGPGQDSSLASSAVRFSPILGHHGFAHVSLRGRSTKAISSSSPHMRGAPHAWRVTLAVAAVCAEQNLFGCSWESHLFRSPCTCSDLT